MADTNFRGSNPADGATEITPHDSNDLATVARSLYIGAGGDVKIDTPNGDTVTFNGVLGGTILFVRANRVYATGTTASDIVALH